jgi:hypothetical protein
MANSNEVLRKYLHQQAETDASQALVHEVMSRDGPDETAIVEHIDKALLDEFKQQVKLWWDLDTAVKRLQQAAKERKKLQVKLSAKILEFMQRHNIEDLNTKDGVLRYKSTYVKAPISTKDLKDKLSTHFSENSTALDIIKRTFEEREKVEKVSLRRVKL